MQCPWQLMTNRLRWSFRHVSNWNSSGIRSSYKINYPKSRFWAEEMRNISNVPCKEDKLLQHRRKLWLSKRAKKTSIKALTLPHYQTKITREGLWAAKVPTVRVDHLFKKLTKQFKADARQLLKATSPWLWCSTTIQATVWSRHKSLPTKRLDNLPMTLRLRQRLRKRHNSSLWSPSKMASNQQTWNQQVDYQRKELLWRCCIWSTDSKPSQRFHSLWNRQSPS